MDNITMDDLPLVERDRVLAIYAALQAHQGGQRLLWSAAGSYPGCCSPLWHILRHHAPLV